VQDALPVLQRAANVHAVTFADEKALPSPQANDLLRAYLFARGVEITPATKSAQNLHVGRGILDYALIIGADAIVMGGYGHGRAAEIALGGSTHHVLEHTIIPVLLSH
jgi:nucleotide-binding universal stress UspA family protein